jgi:hypothetical protein
MGQTPRCGERSCLAGRLIPADQADQRAAGRPVGNPPDRRYAPLHGLSIAQGSTAAAEPQSDVRPTACARTFRREFPPGFPVQPWQIRAESPDAVATGPAVVGMSERVRDLIIPVTIIAGSRIGTWATRAMPSGSTSQFRIVTSDWLREQAICSTMRFRIRSPMPLWRCRTGGG